MPSVDQAIATLAVRRHGIVTREEVLTLGLDDNAIARRVKLGRLYRVHPGVYSVGKPARTNLERAAAAVLACGAGAALSHTSALALWGFAKRWPARLNVMVPGDRRLDAIKIHRSRTFTARDVRTQLGIRVTSPARTLLDCAPDLTDKRLTRVVNDALRSGHLHLSTLAETIARSPRHPGAARLRPFIEQTTNATRSDLEDTFLSFCERFGLPRPKVNAKIAGYEVDAIFEDEKVIVELDGWEFHRSRDSFEGDRNRDADTLLVGYVTVRITRKRIVETPEAEAARLLTILAARRRRAA